MDSLYAQTNAMLQEVETSLGRLDSCGSEHVERLEREIQTRIDSAFSNVKRLDSMVNREPPSKRSTAKMRVDQLKYDGQHLQAALNSIQKRRLKRESEERDRQALFSGHVAATSNETVVNIESEQKHQSRLCSANKNMDQMIEQSELIYQNLREQHSALKRIRTRILDIGHWLGLSNTVMRYIEKRGSQDKIILVVGIVLTLLIMFFIWYYFA